MRKQIKALFFCAVILSMCFLSAVTYAADYRCEVMSLKGSAFVLSDTGEKKPLKEGDTLGAGKTIEVGKESYVDLAYDKGWNNVTRIGADSKVSLRSIYPTGLYMSRGDILAKLQKLPAKSTFEVETPTAVAAVRGSEYRTVADEEGKTQIYNLHKSEVEVYSKDLDGVMSREPVVLTENQKTAVDRLGDTPKTPEMMPEKEAKENHELSDHLNQRVESETQSGQLGQIQDIAEVEKKYSEDVQQRLERLHADDRATAAEPREAPADESSHERARERSGEASEAADRANSNLANIEKRTDKINETVEKRLENDAERVQSKIEDGRNRDQERADHSQQPGKKDTTAPANTGGSPTN